MNVDTRTATFSPVIGTGTEILQGAHAIPTFVEGMHQACVPLDETHELGGLTFGNTPRNPAKGSWTVGACPASYHRDGVIVDVSKD